jgi:hypothetical protein
MTRSMPAWGKAPWDGNNKTFFQAPTARSINPKGFKDGMTGLLYGVLMTRVFGPHFILRSDSRGVASGWHGVAPLVLMNL